MTRAPLVPHRAARDVASVALREAQVTLRSGLWPFARLDPLPDPVPRPGRVPVVLVHGYMGHREMLRPLARRLLQDGWPRVERVGYPSTVWSFERIVDEVARVTLGVAADHGGPVDLVGHSLGALASRAWIKRFGGAPHVRRFVSLGGPHGGTAWHVLVPSPVRSAFDPDGGWVSRIAEGPEPVPTTVVRARYDHQVFPPSNACIPDAREVVVEAWGHNGLLWSDEAWSAVEAALTAP